MAVGFVLVPILVLSRLAAGRTSHRSSSQPSANPTIDLVYRGYARIYRLGMGELVIDLRDVDFAGRTVQLEAQVGMGELLVRIPEGWRRM